MSPPSPRRSPSGFGTSPRRIANAVIVGAGRPGTPVEDASSTSPSVVELVIGLSSPESLDSPDAEPEAPAWRSAGMLPTAVGTEHPVSHVNTHIQRAIGPSIGEQGAGSTLGCPWQNPTRRRTRLLRSWRRRRDRITRSNGRARSSTLARMGPAVTGQKHSNVDTGRKRGNVVVTVEAG